MMRANPDRLVELLTTRLRGMLKPRRRSGPKSHWKIGSDNYHGTSLETPGLPQVDRAGQSLTYASILVDHLGVGGRFNLSDWGDSFVATSKVSVTKGVLTETAIAAQAVGPASIQAPELPSVRVLRGPAVDSPPLTVGAGAASVPFAASTKATFAPTSFADSYDSMPGTVVSLRDAVAAANSSTATGTVTINLQSGEYLLSLPQAGAEDGTNGNLVASNTTHTLLIKGKGTIGTSATMIDARELNDRILQLSPGTVVILNDLILTGGLAGDDGVFGVGPARGGAILDEELSLTLKDAWIVANKAQGGTSGDAQGGGIYVAGGTLALYRSLVAMNTAAGSSGGSGSGGSGGNAQGGGLYVAAGSITLGTVANPIRSNRTWRRAVPVARES
jgi:hypothetical protein